MTPRAETFYVTINQPFVDVYLPKQGSKEVRPVRRVVMLQQFIHPRDPYFFQDVTDAAALNLITITLRDPQDRELVRDAPAWMFGTNQQFAKPSITVPVPLMHANRNFGPMLIDPQRTSVRATAPLLRTNTVALQFIYTD